MKPENFQIEAERLLPQLTVEEKLSLCSGANFWHLKSVERLDLPRIMVADGPHGLRKQSAKGDHVGLGKSVPATCFPTAVSLAATWDKSLLQEVGDALGAEARWESLAVLLGPGVNIKRHPCCGRNFEYFSEDPLLSGELAASFISGVQHHGVGTSLKHFAANNREEDRMVVDTLVDERTLREIYFPAFEIAVKKSQPWTVMCAYNQLNGEFCSEHDWLLNQVLRTEWGFEGLVMTDWGAQNNRTAGLISGLDLEMPGSGGVNDAKMFEDFKQGLLDESIIDVATLRLLKLMLAGRASIFEPESTKPKPNMDDHHMLARRVALQSAVLLKNEAQTLPFTATGTIALIGGFIEQPRYQGAGSSMVNPYQLDTAKDCFTHFLAGTAELICETGFDAATGISSSADIAAAVSAAKQAGQVVLMVGLPASFEAEGADRLDLNLPSGINALISAVLAVNSNTVIVLSNGSPIAMPWVGDAKAILETYLSGQAGAAALAELVFGVVSPSGKLAETFPLVLEDVPANQSFYDMPKQLVYRDGLNVGYRYYETASKAVLFPFGHGLSYTQFLYSDLVISATQMKSDEVLNVSLKLTNTGDVAGAEIVQLYVSDLLTSVFRPCKELKGFDKIFLEAGATQTINFELSTRDFSFYDVKTQAWQVEEGDFEILIGASVVSIKLQATVFIESNYLPDTDLKPQNAAALSDAELLKLGLRIPAIKPIKPYHENSTLADVQGSVQGRQLLTTFMEQIFPAAKVKPDQSEANIGKKDSKSDVLFNIVKAMPLRNLVTMSRGALSAAALERILVGLNAE